MRSRFWMELTTPEVGSYLSQGGDLAILPVGSVEMHGPHQPLGTDSLLAKAFALKLAEAANGLVLPELHYTWTGSTDGFAGTISVEVELAQGMAKAIALKVLRMGFKRLLLLSCHSPNKQAFYIFTRHFYEEHGVSILFIDAYDALDEEASAIFAEPYSRSKEASLVLAALEILGQRQLYCEEEMRREDQAPPAPQSLRNIQKVGVIGFFMQDARQHACPSPYVSRERGLAFIARQVTSILPALEQWKTYLEEIKTQHNKGWWSS